MGHEHAEAVDDAAALLTGFFDEPGDRGIGNDVGDDHLGRNRVHRQGDARLDIGEKADRSRIDEDLGALGGTEVAVPGHVGHREVASGRLDRFAQFAGEERLKFATAGLVAIHEGDARAARQRHFHTDGPGRAARSEQDERFSGRIGQFAKAGDEPFSVGVLPDEAAVAIDDAIDRSHERGRFAEAVEMLDHRDLVGDRAIEPAKAEGTGSGDGGGEITGPHLESEVAPVEPHRPEGRLDHCLGRILRHGKAEATH